MKTWAASLRATQNLCSDNWNNRDFVLTMLEQENFFLLFLGIINFYIHVYSSYSFISSITIKNMLHSWKQKCIARNALYNKSNNYRKHTKNPSYRTVLVGAGEHIYMLRNKYTLLLKQQTESKRSSCLPIQRSICFKFRALYVYMKICS